MGGQGKGGRRKKEKRQGREKLGKGGEEISGYATAVAIPVSSWHSLSSLSRLSSVTFDGLTCDLARIICTCRIQ